MNEHEPENDTKELQNNKLIEGQISIEEEKSKTIAHKNSALQRLDVSFNKNIELADYKRSNLLAYWVVNFSEYHDNEKNFDPTTLKTFKRGDIVKVNLGFRVGKEFGGLHYCVVINKNDNPYSKTLNIVPLTSVKEGKTYNQSTCIDLKDELYALLFKKFQVEYTKLNKTITELNEKMSINKNMVLNAKPLLQHLDYLEKIKDEINHMKHGTIVYVHQITTISKQRIFKTPILSGIKLSNNSLDLIDEKIIKLFTK